MSNQKHVDRIVIGLHRKNDLSNLTENLSFCEYSAYFSYRLLTKDRLSVKFDRPFFLCMGQKLLQERISEFQD